MVRPVLVALGLPSWDLHGLLAWDRELGEDRDLHALPAWELHDQFYLVGPASYRRLHQAYRDSQVQVVRDAYCNLHDHPEPSFRDP